MDTKELTDKIAYLQGTVDDLSNFHQQDFTYFSQWLRELDTKVNGFQNTLVKFEKTGQFNAQISDVVKSAVQSVPLVQGRNVSKLKIALAAGAGVYIGIKVNQVYQTRQSKKEQ